ncbi:MAG: hypothetical protein KGK07_07400 [Chloroflexota bacterium]|nr:hypothetical protein [Chloroflexota bacterium]
MTDDIAPLVAQVQRERRAVLEELYRARFGDNGGGPAHSIDLRSVPLERVAPSLSRLAADRLAGTYPEIAAPDGYTRAGCRVWITPAGIAEVERMCAAREDDAALVETIRTEIVLAWREIRDAPGVGVERGNEIMRAANACARKVVAMVRGEA